MLLFVDVGGLFTLVQSVGQLCIVRHSQVGTWYFIFTSLLAGLEESQWCLQCWHSNPFQPLLQSFHLLGQCLLSSILLLDLDGSPATYLLLFWVNMKKSMLLTLNRFGCFVSFYGRISCTLTPPCAILQARRSWVAECESCFHLWVSVWALQLATCCYLCLPTF